VEKNAKKFASFKDLLGVKTKIGGPSALKMGVEVLNKTIC
jgi:hypothetical protein